MAHTFLELIDYFLMMCYIYIDWTSYRVNLLPVTG